MVGAVTSPPPTSSKKMRTSSTASGKLRATGTMQGCTPSTRLGAMTTFTFLPDRSIEALGASSLMI